ncbi:MAG TPA: hypothetical protein VLE48_08050 [Terriglobales bacterium]|nr:hypothetical protein [Terriglobales bacterium]
MQDDLTSLMDDMTAFIEGHGLRRFHGYVGEEVQTVLWDQNEAPDSWKDFVELAKGGGATFLSMHGGPLTRQEVDTLIERLNRSKRADPEDLEEARWLRTYIGRTGFVQIGWLYQGTALLYEVSTEWYERYEALLDLAEDFGNVGDEAGADDER